jgi:pyridinium-3,5-biscarboxylic acid mononucleotide synthase
MKKPKPQRKPAPFAQVDLDRQERCGSAEVIFGSGKTPEQILQIALTLKKAGQSVLVTRTSLAVYQKLKPHFSGLQHDPTSQLVYWKKTKPRSGSKNIPDKSAPLNLVVCAAGTSDISVAEEAARTAEFFDNHVERVYDVGVAGLQRLLTRLDTLRKADAIIAVAGMEGALPSVIGGLVACPVIAVPTSVGYGANLQGITALLGMLTSCASGLTVVNIDNGFGAAMAAQRMKQLRIFS